MSPCPVTRLCPPMTLHAIEPALLADILGGAYVPRSPPADATARLACELAGDAALVQREYEEALQAYKATRGTSWRLRSKMGYCCYQLDRWEPAARYLEDAPRRGEAVPLAMLIYSLGVVNARTGANDEQLDALVRILLDLPNPRPDFYEFAERHLIDQTYQLEQLQAGHRRFPAHAGLRRIYTRALWGAEHPEEDLLRLVQEAVDAPDVAPEDLWQGFEITSHFGRYHLALALVRRLGHLSTEHEQRVLALVEADTHSRAGEFDAAADVFRTLIGSADLGDDESRELGLRAARGLLHLSAARNDSAGVEAAADALAAGFCHFGVMAIIEQPSPLDSERITITAGSWAVGYSPLASLVTYRQRILDMLAGADMRALFKVLYAAMEGPNADLSKDEASDLILSAGRESTSPCIQRHVAWELMETGEFEEAGRSFARFDLARAAEAPSSWSIYDDESIFEEAPYDDESVVDQFAAGMIEVLLVTANDHEEWLGEHVHEIAAAYLRKALLHYKLYTRFYRLLDGIVGLHRAAEVAPTDAIWFDYGLACQLTARFEQASDAYRSCIVLNPKHSTAQMNLLTVLPPAARSAAVIKQAIASFGQTQPPASIDEMPLKQAVYLLTLYRACGGAEQDLVLHPFGRTEQPFAPTPELLQPLFSLLDAGLVRISSQSPTAAFTIEQAPDRVTKYMLPQMYWELPTATMDRIREIEQACLARQWPDAWREQAPDLVREIARHECLAYLRHLADERSLPMTAGEKTFMMIDNALATYSVGQTYAFCWQGAKAAVDFRARRNVSALHAANTIVGNCQRSIDLARTKQWAVENFTRPSPVRRTHLSYVLYDAFMGFGDRSFTTPLAQLFEEQVGLYTASKKPNC